MRNWLARLWVWLFGAEPVEDLSDADRAEPEEWRGRHYPYGSGENPADYRPEGSEDGR